MGKLHAKGLEGAWCSQVETCTSAPVVVWTPETETKQEYLAAGANNVVEKSGGSWEQVLQAVAKVLDVTYTAPAPRSRPSNLQRPRVLMSVQAAQVAAAQLYTGHPIVLWHVPVTSISSPREQLHGAPHE
jgi:hypothetical protein